MKIAIVSINFYPERIGIGKYNTDFVKSLIEKGHEVAVVTAPPHYPDWNISEGYKNSYQYERLFGAEVFRCPIYIPKKPGNLKRILHLVSFSLSSSYRLGKLLNKDYDLIFLVQPTLFCAPFVIGLGSLYKIKVSMHVQDFEIDAMLGLSNSKKAPYFIRLVKSLEKRIMKKFDFVSTISSSMERKLRDKGVDSGKIISFPNWSSSFLLKNRNSTKFRRKYSLNDDDFLVLYSGNMGRKQGLEIVLEAAEKLQDLEKVKIFMAGNGVHRDHLEKIRANLRLVNVKFIPLQDSELFNDMLNSADLHLVIQRNSIADVVMPSKLTNILAVGGHAIVTAHKETELGQLALRYPHIYRIVTPDSAKDLEDAIRLAANSTNRNKINQVAKDYADNYLDMGSIIDSFISKVKN